MRVLLLDNTFSPVKILSWQKAMILFLTGKAEVVDSYQDVEIRSAQQRFPLPKILRLFSRHRTLRDIPMTRENIFIRDGYQCQYCGDKKNLTLDHVIPKSKGGKNTWSNLVACCSSCNTEKGSKTVEEFRKKLTKTPRAPSWFPGLGLKIRKEDPEEWEYWVIGPKRDSA